MPDLIDIEAFRRQREASRSHSGKNVCPNRLLTGEGRRLLKLCTEFLGQPPRYRGAGDREVYFKWTSRPASGRWKDGREYVLYNSTPRDAPDVSVLPILADYLEDAGLPRPRVVECVTFGDPEFKLYFPVSY
jgi:hypothetical protein